MYPLPSGEGSSYAVVRTKVSGVGELARPALGRAPAAGYRGDHREDEVQLE